MAEELAGLRDLRDRLLLLKKECQAIGQVPPRPNTVRAALSGMFVSFMQRLMFWYAPPLQRTIGGLIQTVEDALQVLETRFRQQEQRSAALETRLHQTHAAIDEQVQALQALRAHAAELQTRLQQERATTIDLENEFHEQVDGWQQFQEERVAREQELASQLRAGEERLQMLRRELVEHARRVGELLEEARRRLPPPLDEQQLRVFEQESLHDLDPLYSSLADETRGTREEVREGLRVYLPVLERVKAKLPRASVLDLGCGRGEWLELLRNEGYTARGVDWNRSLVEDCRGRQLEVAQGDVLEHLAGVPDASIAVVTAFHLAEHLPFRKLVRLLDEITRVLQTGGVAILETPNPDNLLAGATHCRLMSSGTLRFLVESRGLSQVEVMPLHPEPGVEGEGELADRFNRLFSGPRDYAVVGWKL
jgi:O-antigen chain-terminating methyltransferase